MWTNYHTHTTWCDGKKSIEDLVAEGQRKNLAALGFSSHAPLPFERKWCMKPNSLTGYLGEIDRFRHSSSMEIYAGLEVDFIPGKISPSDFRKQLDYVIGSVHFVDALPDGNGWEIDGPYEEFRKGFVNTFKSDMKSVVTRYYELTRQMIYETSPDIVGHLDKIKIQNKEGSTFREDDHWYVSAIRQTLKVIKEVGSIVEVNTRGLYQRKTATPYPSPWVLREICDLGIPVTLSSDAHHPDDLVNHFSEAAAILLQAGIKKIRILTDGKWKDAGFDEQGIKDHKVAD